MPGGRSAPVPTAPQSEALSVLSIQLRKQPAGYSGQALEVVDAVQAAVSQMGAELFPGIQTALGTL